MKNFTPRHLRRGYSNKSGPKDPTKSRAFRRCKRISDLFIHQSASALASPALAAQYEAYRAKTISGDGFRKG